MRLFRCDECGSESETAPAIVVVTANATASHLCSFDCLAAWAIANEAIEETKRASDRLTRSVASPLAPTELHKRAVEQGWPGT